jgi:endonuclease YncB( thermonuclease family)
MKYAIVRALGTALCVLCCSFTANAAPGVLRGVIEKVVDGDTVHFHAKAFRGLTDGLDLYASTQKVTVRMIGMDAPETHFPTPDHGTVGQQPWGDQAVTYIQKMIHVGSPVTLQTWGMDKYNRTLGFVFDAKTDINLQMVRGGWAAPYIICTGRDCNRQFFTNNRVREYLMSCDAARKERRGIFAASNPMKEMPFEFRMRMAKRTPDKFVGNYDTMELYEPRDYKKVDLCRSIFFMNEEEAKKIGFKRAR